MRKSFLKSQELIKAINESDLIKSYCGIPSDWKNITKITSNSIHRQVGKGQFNAKFYSSSKIKDRIDPKILLALGKEGVFAHLEKKYGEKVWESFYETSYAKPKLVKYASASFTPDANPETSSVDGYMINEPAVNENWASIIDGDATSVDDSDATLQVRITAGKNSGEYSTIAKAKVLFDTSSIGAGYYVDSADFNITPSLTSVDDFSMSLSLVSATTVSNTSLAVGDFALSTFGSILLATDKTIASMTDDLEFTMALNTNGIANIDMEGVSKFGLIPDGEPTWSSNGDSRLVLYSADSANDPSLDVTYFEISGYINLPLMGVG